jgi:carboxyl-terminal processing protease
MTRLFAFFVDFLDRRPRAASDGRAVGRGGIMFSSMKSAFGRFGSAVLALGLGLALVLSPAPAPAAGAAAEAESSLFEKLKIFSLVIHEVENKFVEKPQSDEMVYGAIRGMLSTLDPHSSFLTPEEMKEFQQEAQGSFFGVGIEISVRDGFPTVVSPIEGTPAYRAGLQAGDQIIKIDDKPTKDMSLTEAVKLIRGPKGTKVVFTISRESTKSMHTYSVVRDLIPIRSVRSEMLEPDIGYVRIISFQGDTSQETLKALKAFPPLKGLILDVRNDPGGLLDQSIKVSGLFLGPELVVETKGRIEDQNVSYKADNQMVLPVTCPMVVLVNEGSASASEIVAGALQDHKRALVVGAKSFGKGSVQTILPLPDGSGLRLTTARFYTPSGRSIQADGITPDVLVPSRLPPEAEVIREKDLDRHLVGANEKPKDRKTGAGGDPKKASGEAEEFEMPDRPLSELPLIERLKFDPQLDRALTLLKTNKVPNKFASR